MHKRVYLYMHKRVYLYVYKRVHLYVQESCVCWGTYVYVHIWDRYVRLTILSILSMCVCMYVCMYVYTRMFLCLCAYLGQVRAPHYSVYVFMYVCMYVCMYVYTRMFFVRVYTADCSIPSQLIYVSICMHNSFIDLNTQYMYRLAHTISMHYICIDLHAQCMHRFEYTIYVSIITHD